MKKRVLFVCMGNICRSPAAEGIFREQLEKRGLAEFYEVDSAGTIGYHTDELPDSRMRAACQQRGVTLTHRARKVTAQDLQNFDLIIAMDRDNVFHLHALDRNGEFDSRIKLYTDYDPTRSSREVPDPYYGGQEGFELVIDLVERCGTSLIDSLEKERLG
jgi:protein-tyrosine phosphatase